MKHKHYYETHRYDDVGKCIYCGKTDSLTNEHIVPLTLNGTLLLPKSSCKNCNVVTSKLEIKVLRGFMLNARRIKKLNSRRKKQQSKNISVSLIDQENNKQLKEFLLSEGVSILHLPRLTIPSVIHGLKNKEGVKLIALETIHLGQDFDEFSRKNNALCVRFETNIDIYAFTKLLAKIAHGYLVAEEGLFPRSESPLLPIIHGEEEFTASWIGSPIDTSIFDSVDPKALHALAITSVDLPVVGQSKLVYIKLFSGWGATVCFCIVARVFNPKAVS